jgi:hypothetical protein
MRHVHQHRLRTRCTTTPAWNRRRGPHRTRPRCDPHPRPRDQAVVDEVHRGAVTNLTVGKTASLVIKYTRAVDSTIAGAVTIGAELIGTGPLRGTITDTTIAFSTIGDQCSIEWTGSISARHLAGVYRVSAPDLPIPEQLGVWAVSR